MAEHYFETVATLECIIIDYFDMFILSVNVLF